MGVGKTIQAISTAYLYKNDWPLLVITPSSLKFQWKDEILKWIPTIQATDIQLFKKGNEPFKKECLIFIMSYPLAAKNYIELQ
jgi:SNF2 family DNA or RNA helicase